MDEFWSLMEDIEIRSIVLGLCSETLYKRSHACQTSVLNHAPPPGNSKVRIGRKSNRDSNSTSRIRVN